MFGSGGAALSSFQDEATELCNRGRVSSAKKIDPGAKDAKFRHQPRPRVVFFCNRRTMPRSSLACSRPCEDLSYAGFRVLP